MKYEEYIKIDVNWIIFYIFTAFRQLSPCSIVSVLANEIANRHLSHVMAASLFMR